MPSGVTAYHSFGQEAAVNANDLAIFPQSIARDVALVMMLVHYIVGKVKSLFFFSYCIFVPSTKSTTDSSLLFQHLDYSVDLCSICGRK